MSGLVDDGSNTVSVEDVGRELKGADMDSVLLLWMERD